MILFEGSRSRSALEAICHEVSKMKPGQRYDVPSHVLMGIATHEHNGAHFSAPDRVLGNIIGSAYTHSYQWHPNGMVCTFVRHENTGERRYKDPDHDYRLKMIRSRRALEEDKEPSE